MRRGILSRCVQGLALLVVLTGAANAIPLIQVEPSTPIVDKGELFTVEIRVGSPADSVFALLGVGFQLDYNPQAIEVLSVSPGLFLDDSTLVEFQQLLNAEGRTAYSVARTSGTGVSGEGIVAVLNCRVSASAPLGQTNLTLSLVDAIDTLGANVALSPVGASIEIDAGAFTDVENALPLPINTLMPPFPNPFNPRTTIRLSLSRPSELVAEVYNVGGRFIAVLAHDFFKSGWHQIEWNGISDLGEQVPSGVYMLRLVVEDQVVTKRVVLLR